MKKIIAFVFVMALFFSSCEKDDICDANTATTPRLVITFYDINNSSVLKNVTNLKVIGAGMTEGIVFNSATDNTKYLTSGSKISIPLRTDADATTYRFILNSGNTNPIFTDTDEVTFNYSRNTIFVSRACGFKTIFEFIAKDAIFQTAIPATKQKWMQYLSVEKTIIDKENETHIKVFF